MNPGGDELIVALADKFVGKKADSKTLEECLELVCENFYFDCGVIYDIDQYNHLNAKERFTKADVQVKEIIDAEKISKSCYDHIVNVNIVDAVGEVIPEIKEIQDIFETESLILFSVVDEKERIQGLIILMDLAPAVRKRTEEELRTLTVLLSMVGRYAGMRMFQNKADFVQTSLESILDNTGIDIYVNDFNNHDILYVNKSMAAPYGGISAFSGKKCWQVLFPGQGGPCEFCPQNNLTDEEGNPTKVYTWDYQRAFDGSWFRVFSAAFRWIDGRLAHVVSSADITDNKQKEAMIEYMANYDCLTELPNRRMLIRECERLIDSAKDGEEGFLLFFDIDGFKAINDQFGHDAGDEFLIKLGKFFSEIPMLKNSIYRNGGDEFVAVLGGGVSLGNIQSLAHFIHQRFEKPWNLKKGSVQSNVSIGVAEFPKDGKTAEELLAKADKAMYQVKKSGGGGICFGNEP